MILAQNSQSRAWPFIGTAALAVLAFVVLVLCPAQAANQSVTISFDAANKLYEQGKFAEAASAYQQLLKSDQASAAVYYNLGNAFFKAGQIGRAIAAYHQAERITPRDPDLRANLQFARNQIQGPTLTNPTWKRWLAAITLNEWTVLAGGIVWMWFVLLTVLQWRPAHKPALRVYVPVLGIAAALLCVVLAIAWREARWTYRAVVITPEVAVRQGPLDESQTAFTLHDGAELQVLDRKDDWLQVTTDPRRIGWVRRDRVILSPNT